MTEVEILVEFIPYEELPREEKIWRKRYDEWVKKGKKGKMP